MWFRKNGIKKEGERSKRGKEGKGRKKIDLTFSVNMILFIANGVKQ